MKKIGFITKNKIFAQSLTSLIKSNPDLPFEPFVLSNLHQAVMDTEILGINIAVVEIPAGMSNDPEKTFSLCMKLRQTAPRCQILLLVSQDNKEDCTMAMKAVNTKTADDYVFLDTSLDYLFAKLLAF